MTKKSKKASRTKAKSLKIERLFDASPERLWTFWTDPTNFAKWFNPAPGMNLVIHEYEARPGGRVRFDMPQPDGNKNPQEGVFHVLDPYREIVTGSEDKSFLIKVNFKPVGTQTRVIVLVNGISLEFHEGALKGWNAGFDKLENALAGWTMPVKTEVKGKSRRELGEIAITRTLDAPRGLVWKAWTDPEWIKRWWGPKVFTAPYCRLDLRVGGHYLYCMRSPDGKDFWSTGFYREIIPMEKIVCTDSFADEKGNIVPATYYGLGPDFPLELVLTVTFEEVKGGTKLTLRHLGHPIGEMKRNATLGWNESLDKFAESVRQLQGGTASIEVVDPFKLTLPSDREIVITRVLNAPRERVFDSYADPNTIPEWWGPRGFRTAVEKMDVRPDGVWRFVRKGPDGKEYAFNGVYREVLRPERLVYTFEYEGMPGHILIETVRLEKQLDGNTKVTVTDSFQTRKDRDGMLQSGMEKGARESMERLEELLREYSPP